MGNLNPSYIDIDARESTVYKYMTLLKENALVFDFPEMKCQYEDKWDSVTKSRMVESFFLGFPLPSLWLQIVSAKHIDSKQDMVYNVIDGHNIIKVIDDFAVKNELVLEGLEYLTSLNGKKYSDLSSTLQRSFTEVLIKCNVVRGSIPQEVKMSIYSRVNSKYFC